MDYIIAYVPLIKPVDISAWNYYLSNVNNFELGQETLKDESEVIIILLCIIV